MNRWRRIGILGGIVAALGWAALLMPWVLRLEETAGLEALFSLRGPLPAPAEVAVVTIDRDAATALGQSPRLDRWSRTLHAELIEQLRSLDVAAIAFDISFEAPREPEGDASLAAAMAAAGNVLLLERVSADTVAGTGPNPHLLETRLVPLPAFRAAAWGSAPFPLPVVPIKVSQFWAFGRASSDMPTLPALALQAYARDAYPLLAAQLDALYPDLMLPAALPETDLDGLMSRLRRLFQEAPALGDRLRTLLAAAGHDPSAGALAALLELYEGQSAHYLNYFGPQRSLMSVAYDRVIKGDLEASEQAKLAGRVVFVGYSESRQPEQQDDFYSVYSQETGMNLGGVEIGATAFANLLHRNSTQPLPMPAHWALSLFWPLLLAAAWLWPRSLFVAVGLVALLAATYTASAWASFSARQLWLPLILPLGLQLPAVSFGALAWNYLRARKQADRVQRALGFYLPSRIVAELAKETVDIDANAQLLHGSCLVTDVEQYTAVAENLAPDALRELLNAYYRVIFAEIERHGGIIADVVGDSTVAVWPRSEPVPEMREQACAAAIAVRDAITAFNRSTGHPRLPTRLGVHVGQVMLGNVGSLQRFEYRAVGDIVNTAARIQGLNKYLETNLLVSADTLEGLHGWVTRELGVFILAGKQTALAVHELAGHRRAGAEPGPGWAAFAQGLVEFRAARWSAAERRFAEALDAEPADGPARYYRDLCRRYALEPSLAAASGVVRMGDK